MKTEDEIRAYTIGELKPLTAPIVVSDYDPAWPASFEREAARIRSILGARVELLEHAGSTSVPGLPAKPVIDIDQMLLFRDWLRAHPEDRDLYAAAKRDLAKREWQFTQNYADAKTVVVQQILTRARAATG